MAVDPAPKLDKDERRERIRYLRRWGTTAVAEQVALKIIDALPEGAGLIGIFAPADDLEDEDYGGISFERFTINGGVAVNITDRGAFGDCYYARPGVVHHQEITSPAEAAQFLLRDDWQNCTGCGDPLTPMQVMIKWVDGKPMHPLCRECFDADPQPDPDTVR